MRCQENTGFLVLHRCENEAVYQCSGCGRKICPQHGAPLSPTHTAAPQPTPPPVSSSTGGLLPAPPPPPPTGIQQAPYLCQTCRRRQPDTAPPPGQVAQPGQSAYQRGRAVDDDPYYRYPYFGGFIPLHSPYYYDYRDRSAFDRAPSSTSSGEPDALGS